MIWVAYPIIASLKCRICSNLLPQAAYTPILQVLTSASFLIDRNTIQTLFFWCNVPARTQDSIHSCLDGKFRTRIQVLAVPNPIFNPHQRCGYSDSPFARKDTFLYCRVQKWVWALWIHTQKEVVPKKKSLFSYRKIYWGRQTGWKTRAGSAGSDNEAHWSCKRWVTAKVVQNWPIWIENQENQGLHFSDVRKNPGFDQRSLRGPLFAIFGPARGQIYGKTAKKYKKMRVLARRAGYPSQKAKLSSRDQVGC